MQCTVIKAIEENNSTVIHGEQMSPFILHFKAPYAAELPLFPGLKGSAGYTEAATGTLHQLQSSPQ